ncbi:hypothetical protein [Rhodohalobacter barkolensis]|uniref:Uncharacterized protein n=1 Tax=Rhodohalobacter barkolensis TaxID=2053187 RepID=A0A2N0VFN8_9BACT|nr:hypothetical protein [Rhodohalobacter barkolensis]PKD43004.1 hypothetical protein CWD77_10225 [Rhodohalobacter barkolensis]
MERIVRHITEKLTAQLPRFREFYTPDDLQVLDIPPFITERVILEMHQNLSESVGPPETEWADMDGDSVRFAWKNFLEAIKAEVRMPSSYAAPLLETAVADALELATQPRKAIPEILFGSDTSLSIEKLKKRIRYVTIGRPLAAALIRYMEKKNKTELVIDDCKKIIGQIDEKLISSFNSLDWAKELEPLFVLAGPSVDTDLFRVYFEDKGRKKISRVFDRLNKSLNRTEFIEVMSSPEQLLDEDEDVVKTQKPDTDKKTGPKPPVQETQVTEKGDDENEDAEDSILNSFQKRRGDSLPEEDEEAEISKDSDESEEELHSKFRLDQEDQENEEENLYKEMNLKKSSSDYRSGNLTLDEEEEDEDPKKLHTDLLSKWKAISGDDNDDEDHVDEDKTTSESEVEDLAETDRPDDEDDTGVKSIELYNETDDEEDVPIWRAFLEREDLSSVASEEDRRKKKSDRDDKLEMADKLADRFFGSYDEDADESLEATAEALIEFLSDEKNRFISEIFSGSEKAYEESLEDIALLDDWKSASKFIKDEIFNRNHIDIFDEVAVDFTDRLHTFFKERK